MNVLGMFARLPQPGKTKTRLAASIGDVAAAALYEGFVRDLMVRCSSMADQFTVAVTPDTAETKDWFRGHVGDEVKIVAQPSGGLGDRCEWFFNVAQQNQPTRVVLIGSDSPDIPNSIIRSAFQRLNDVDVVLSPATDGGYVLIGMRVLPQDLFQNVRWSSATTLLDTIEGVSRLGLSMELLPCWYDIDTIENLGTLMPLQKSRGAGNEFCPHTNAAIERMQTRIDGALRIC